MATISTNETASKSAIIVGGIGGTLPIIINLYKMDPASMFRNFDPIVISGYAVQTVILIIIGGLFVLINSERSLKKAFQLGIMAPAIIIGMLNGVNLQNAKQELNSAKTQLQRRQLEKVQNTNNNEEIEKESSFLLNFSIVSLAYAGEENIQLKGIHNDPSMVSRFFYGLTGDSSKTWFVIVGSHRSNDSAEKQVSELRAKGYNAVIFPPYRDNKYYGVMIGSWLSYDKANKLKSQALSDDLPKDTYLWRFRM